MNIKKIKSGIVHSPYGFTLIELLIVITLIGVITTIVGLYGYAKYVEKARLARVLYELREIEDSMELYYIDNHNQYPDDVSRGLPNGLENYIKGGVWSTPPWEGSYYDWDYWDPNDLPPTDRAIQISVRFCDFEDITDLSCKFPPQSFIDDTWDHNSAVFRCISGPCRSHQSKPFDFPGCCIDGDCSQAARDCF